MTKVLVVDDHAGQRNIVCDILAARGNLVQSAENVEQALELVKKHWPEVVVTDLKMPGKSGLQLIEELSGLSAPPEVIVATAFGSVETAIKAIRLGAYDYIAKPIEAEEILFLIEKAREKYLLKQESRTLKQELTREIQSRLVAESEGMKKVLDIIEKVAPADSTVLIQGETGTGKECVARLIHLQSRRAHRPMQGINCAAFPETLLESELFGHEKGAFTGAHRRKIGLVESASGSTLFLDEVADMSLNTQAKVLRVLQEREIRRVGGTENIPVDIRIIAATNKNLEEAIKNGRFREDLYYRLKVVPVYLPPLRERKKDIPGLIAFFLRRMGLKKAITPGALKILSEYSWPGNIRELEGAIERMGILAKKDPIDILDLPADLSRPPAGPGHAPGELPDSGIVFEDLERNLFKSALVKAGGNMIKAAKLLGMSYRAFRYRAKKFGLHKK